MKSLVLKFSEIDTKDRLTVDHYLSDDLQIIKRLERSPYDLVDLGNLAAVKGGKRLPPKALYSSSGIPYIRVIDIGDYEILLSDAVYISDELHQKIKRYQLQKDDIGIVIVGATIGKTAIFKSSVSPCNFNENLARITTNKQKLSPDFLLSYLQSSFGQAYISWLTGGSAQAKLSLERIAKIQVPLPLLSIQDQISQVMQEAYRDRQGKLEQARNLLKGSDDFVFGVLNLAPESIEEETKFLRSISSIKGRRFDVEFNMGFHKFDPYMDQVQPVKAVANFPKEIEDPKTTPEISFNYIDIASIDIELGEIREISEVLGTDAPSRARQVVHTGDIIISTVRPTRGATALIPESMDGFICSTGFSIVHPNKKITSEYLHAALRLHTTLEQFGRRSAGSSYPAILDKDVKETLIPVPDKDIQNKISTEVIRRRSEAKRLRTEAEAVVAEAKARVERMILGEEVGDG